MDGVKADKNLAGARNSSNEANCFFVSLPSGAYDGGKRSNGFVEILSSSAGVPNFEDLIFRIESDRCVDNRRDRMEIPASHTAASIAGERGSFSSRAMCHNIQHKGGKGQMGSQAAPTARSFDAASA